jgi:hypothetical protein
MKAMRFLGLSAAALWSTAMVAAAGLRNGSFEEQGEAPDRAAAWSRWGDWFNRETSWKPTRTGKCLLAYHHWQIQKTDSSGVWQDIADVPRGAEAVFSVYATADKVGQGEQAFQAVELRMETTMYGEQSTIISRRWGRDAIETDGCWSRLQVRSVLPTDHVRVLIIVYPAEGSAPRGGAVKFDDARFEVAPRRP